MGEEEEDNEDYIYLKYKGMTEKIEVPEDYKELLKVFLKTFDEDNKAKFEFYSYDKNNKGRKIIYKDNEYSNFSYFQEREIIYIEEITPQSEDEDEEEVLEGNNKPIDIEKEQYNENEKEKLENEIKILKQMNDELLNKSMIALKHKKEFKSKNEEKDKIINNIDNEFNEKEKKLRDELQSEFDEYKKSFVKENNLSKLVKEKNKEIENLKNDVNEEEKEIKDIKSQIKEKDNLIKRHSREKEEKIQKNEKSDNIYSNNKEKYENKWDELKKTKEINKKNSRRNSLILYINKEEEEELKLALIKNKEKEKIIKNKKKNVLSIIYTIMSFSSFTLIRALGISPPSFLCFVFPKYSK